MLKLDDVVWESEASSVPVHIKQTAKKKSITKKNKPTKTNRQNGRQSSNNTSTHPDPTKLFGGVSFQETGLQCEGVSLKDLNPLDKQRIAHLIKELAKADEEKENIVHTLNNERQQFLSHVKELENDKRLLLNRQDFLAEEVKQCQTLLQYYQNLITMQQNSILAQEDSKKHSDDDSSPSAENSISMRRPKKSSQSKNVSFHEPDHVTSSSADELSSQIDAIRVNEFGNTRNTESSFTDDQILQMDDRQYKFYLERKKLRLTQEQERLRKLLEIKVQNSNLSDIEVSPVRDATDKGVAVDDHADTRNTSLRGRDFTSPPLKQSNPRSPMPSEKSNLFHTPIRNHCTPVPKHSSIHTPNRKDYLSQSNLSKSVTSPSRLTSTLRNSVSQNALFDDVEGNNEITRSFLEVEPLSSVAPMTAVGGQCSSSEAAIASDLLTCDDSQILQDIFFV